MDDLEHPPQLCRSSTLLKRRNQIDLAIDRNFTFTEPNDDLNVEVGNVPIGLNGNYTFTTEFLHIYALYHSWLSQNTPILCKSRPKFSKFNFLVFQATIFGQIAIQLIGN